VVEDSQGEFAASYDIEEDDFIVFRPFPSAGYNILRMDVSEDYKHSPKYEMRVMQSSYSYPLSEMLVEG